MNTDQNNSEKLKVLLEVIVIFLSVAVTVICICVLIRFHSLRQQNTGEEEEQEQVEQEEPIVVTEPEVVEIVSDSGEVGEDIAAALKHLAEADEEMSDTEAFTVIRDGVSAGEGVERYLYAYITGEMLLQGIGTEKNLADAAEYIRMAAEYGLVYAESVWAKMLFTGNPSRRGYGDNYQNYSEAIRYFYTLALNEDPEAAYALGIQYFYGMGTATDFTAAGEWLRVAADAGITEAEALTAKAGEGINTYGLAEATYIPEPVVLKRVTYPEEINELVSRIVERFLEGEDAAVGFTEELASLQPEGIWLDPAGSTGLTLYGNGDWLFYKTAADGNCIRDYIGDPADALQPYYTEEQKRQLAEHLGALQDMIENAHPGARLIIAVIPNKESIYPEFMPSYITRVSERTRTDDIMEYLLTNGNCRAEIVYLKEEMLAQRGDITEQQPEDLLYYQTDTHCNMRGAYLVMAAFMDRLYGKELSLSEVTFNPSQALYTGDLGMMLQRDARYQIDTVWNLDPGTIPGEDRVEGQQVVMLSDSFGEFINMQAQHYFPQEMGSSFTNMFIGNYGFSYYNALQVIPAGQQVDAVVIECAERYIDRLMN